MKNTAQAAHTEPPVPYPNQGGSQQSRTAAWEKAICKELGKTSAIVLAGRNLAKMEAAKAELDELGVESYLCKTDIADRAQVQALADYAASLGDVTQVIHTSGVSPSDTATETSLKSTRSARSIWSRHSIRCWPGAA